MNILALDIATKTGYAHTSDWADYSGVWNLAARKGENKNIRLVKLKNWLELFTMESEVDHIVCEEPFIHGKHKNGMMIGIELHSVVKVFCEENDITYSTVHPNTIKKFATGNGRASKDEMVEAASKFGIPLKDDNHCDALHLLDYVLNNRQVLHED